MVLCARVRKRDGETAKAHFKENNLINHEYLIGKTADKYLFIPLTESPKKVPPFVVSIEGKNLQKVDHGTGSLKDNLRGVIPDELLDRVMSSFEIVGDVAVLDVPKELEQYAVTIAWTLKRLHSNVRTVAKRASITSGKFRIRKLEVLTGPKNTETIYNESGIKLKLDLNEGYFSSKLGNERLRIANKVKPGEKILVMFSGFLPYPLVIARKQRNVWITAIEINPTAVKYAKENLELNKSIYRDIKVMKERIKVIKGDVAKVVPTLKEKFDRIIMPLPKQAEDFMNLALSVANKGAEINLYQFYNEDEAQEKAKNLAKKYGLKLESMERCGAYSPRVFRYCLDLKYS